MEYNTFIRQYYHILMDLGKFVNLTPNIYRVVNDNTNPEYYEKNDSGYFGNTRLKLSAPNDVIENVMDNYSITYPEYPMLFLNKEQLKKASNFFKDEEQIKRMMILNAQVLQKMGLLKISEAQ